MMVESGLVDDEIGSLRSVHKKKKRIVRFMGDCVDWFVCARCEKALAHKSRRMRDSREATYLTKFRHPGASYPNTEHGDTKVQVDARPANLKEKIKNEQNRTSTTPPSLSLSRGRKRKKRKKDTPAGHEFHASSFTRAILVPGSNASMRRFPEMSKKVTYVCAV
jgi:hypothetical protein